MGRFSFDLTLSGLVCPETLDILMVISCACVIAEVLRTVHEEKTYFAFVLFCLTFFTSFSLWPIR